jgi:hypothetical protein
VVESISDSEDITYLVIAGFSQVILSIFDLNTTIEIVVGILSPIASDIFTLTLIVVRSEISAKIKK